MNRTRILFSTVIAVIVVLVGHSALLWISRSRGLPRVAEPVWYLAFLFVFLVGGLALWEILRSPGKGLKAVFRGLIIGYLASAFAYQLSELLRPGGVDRVRNGITAFGADYFLLALVFPLILGGWILGAVAGWLSQILQRRFNPF